MSKSARKKLARAQSAGMRTGNFVRRQFEAAGELDKRAANAALPETAAKLRALAENLRTVAARPGRAA